MPYDFQLTRRVEFADTDMAGIMHFSNFFRFMEAAETAFMRSLGFSVVLSRCGLEVCLPRVHAECDYAAPLRFEDEVRIHLLVEKKTSRTLTYQFRFLRLNGDPAQEVARGRLTLVCAASQADGTLKAVPLPPALAGKLEEAPAAILADNHPARRGRVSLTRLDGVVGNTEPGRAVSPAQVVQGAGPGPGSAGRNLKQIQI